MKPVEALSTVTLAQVTLGTGSMMNRAEPDANRLEVTELSTLGSGSCVRRRSFQTRRV